MSPTRKSAQASGKLPSRKGSPNRITAQPPRQRSACESCHASKVKCSGGTPCTRCGGNKTECVYKEMARIGKPPGSKNKSTIRREQLEAEQKHHREQAERSRSRIRQPNGLSNTNQISLLQSTVTNIDSSPGLSLSWNYVMPATYWAQKNGTQHFPPMNSHIAPNQWPYRNELPPVSNSVSSLVNPASYEEDRVFIPSNVHHLEDHRDNASAVRLPSVHSESSYTSSRWDGSAIATTSPPDDSSSFPALEIFSQPPTHDFPAHTSCHCAEGLASQLCSFHRPEILNSTTHTAQGFLANTNHLLSAIESFLECGICEKNSMALSLMTTVFATFGQLFAALAGTSYRSDSPSGLSPHLLGGSNLERRLSFGGYDPANEGESAIRTMLVGQTAQRWRDGCFKANRLLDYLLSRAQGSPYELDASQYNPNVATGGEGTPLWNPKDIESFMGVVSRVNNELASFSQ